MKHPVALFACTLLLFSAFAQAEEPMAESTADTNNAEEESILRGAVGVGLGYPYLYEVAGRVGADINGIVELGVTGKLTGPGTVGPGLYAKVPFGKEKDWYAIGEVGRNHVFGNNANVKTIDEASIGIGHEFRPGAFIEARVGTAKRNFHDSCRHNDWGDCKPGGSDNRGVFMIRVGTAF